jgi:branched-chain amino acid transport system substrate-binding protein
MKPREFDMGRVNFRVAGRLSLLAAILAGGVASGLAGAEIVIGVSHSGTGPGAALGIPARNTIAILPKTIAGETVRYVVADDASDATAGSKLVRQFAAEKADVVIGSSTVPVAAAQAAAANDSRLAFLALCPIALDPAKLPWIFSIPQAASLMVGVGVDHMKANGTKSIGFIGFTDAWGDLTLGALQRLAAPAGMTIVASERFARNDTSVTAQAIRVLAAKPDTIFLGDAGTPGALPHFALAERGFKGRIYHAGGVVTHDFIRVGGKAVEGGMSASGAVVVADQLPDGHPLKAVGVDFLKKYEGAYGPGSRNAFAAYAYDAWLVIAAAIPEALKKAKPGTQEFRQALRDSITAGREVVGTHAIYRINPTNHNGVDKRDMVLVQVQNGEWRLAK